MALCGDNRDVASPCLLPPRSNTGHPLSQTHSVPSAQPSLGCCPFPGVFLPAGAQGTARLCLGSWIMKLIPSVSFKLHIGNTK